MILGLCLRKVLNEFNKKIISVSDSSVRNLSNHTIQQFSPEAMSSASDEGQARGILQEAVEVLKSKCDADVTQFALKLASVNVELSRKYRSLNLSAIFEDNCKVRIKNSLKPKQE